MGLGPEGRRRRVNAATTVPEKSTLKWSSLVGGLTLSFFH
jgi:hypothetical protein